MTPRVPPMVALVAIATVPVKLAALLMVWPLIRPELTTPRVVVPVTPRVELTVRAPVRPSVPAPVRARVVSTADAPPAPQLIVPSPLIWNALLASAASSLLASIRLAATWLVWYAVPVSAGLVAPPESVVSPVTPRVPPTVEFDAIATVPVKLAALLMVWPLIRPELTTPRVEVPVTPRVPPMVALLVTESAVPAPDSVTRPEPLTTPTVVVPVTPSVPPMVALVAIAAEPVKLAALLMVWPLIRPEFTTPSVVVPVTPRVPPTVALLVTANAVPAPESVTRPEPLTAPSVEVPLTASEPSVPTPVIAGYEPPARSALLTRAVESVPEVLVWTTPAALRPLMVTDPAEFTVNKLTPALVCKSRMSAAVPLVSWTVRPTTPPAVGVTVFCALVVGTRTKQPAQPVPDAQYGKAPGPPDCKT